MQTYSVEVSDDGREMTIRPGDGRVLTMHSRDGFTPEQIAHAEQTVSLPNVAEGQVNRVRRFAVGGWRFYVHVNTGPPTWWVPHVEVTRRSVMVGWFRGLIAVSVSRS